MPLEAEFGDTDGLEDAVEHCGAAGGRGGGRGLLRGGSRQVGSGEDRKSAGHGVGDFIVAATFAEDFLGEGLELNGVGDGGCGEDALPVGDSEVVDDVADSGDRGGPDRTSRLGLQVLLDDVLDCGDLGGVTGWSGRLGREVLVEGSEDLIEADADVVAQGAGWLRRERSVIGDLLKSLDKGERNGLTLDGFVLGSGLVVEGFGVVVVEGFVDDLTLGGLGEVLEVVVDLRVCDLEVGSVGDVGGGLELDFSRRLGDGEAGKGGIICARARGVPLLVKGLLSRRLRGIDQSGDLSHGEGRKKGSSGRKEKLKVGSRRAC